MLRARRCVSVAAWAAATSLTLPLSSYAATPFQLDDIDRLAEVSAPAFSADGNWIAYVVKTSNAAEDKSTTDLWRVSWDGKSHTQLTHTQSDSEWSPHFSPDGKWLAFLADRGGEDATTQVWLMPVAGGEAQKLTEFAGGVSEFVWSPDSKQLAVIAKDPDPNAEKQKAAPKLAPPPIVIDRFQFKSDEDGYLGRLRKHIYLFELASKHVEQLTRGDHDEQFLAWSPNGASISYVSKRGDDPDRHNNYDLYLIAPQFGAPERRLTNYSGADCDPYWESAPAWSPDSKRIAYLQGGEPQWIGYGLSELAIVDVDSGEITLPARIDRNFLKPKWSADGRSIYALIEQSRDTYLARVDLSDGSIKALTQRKRFDVDVAVSGNGRVAVLGGGDARPAELSAVESKLRGLTAHNEWLAERQLAKVEDIEFKSRDGTQVHGMLLKPVGYVAGKRYPAILRIHGGPVYQFSHEFMAEWQYYAAQGFAVILANPRGSSGRGFEYAKAIYADWGNKDADDVLAAVDHVVALGVVDADRLVVGGWSYGSILTNYVLVRDARFKAAFSGAGASNFIALYGHDQYVRDYEVELGRPWEQPEAYTNLSSPFLHADRIKTPTLFLCAQLDFNVPCLGAEQMYQALRSLDVPTQLILYPEEHHGLASPSHIKHRLKSYIDWSRRFVGP